MCNISFVSMWSKDYNYFSPVVVTSVLMKSLKQFLIHLMNAINSKLYSYQFAYKHGCSTESTVVALWSAQMPYIYLSTFLGFFIGIRYHSTIYSYLIHWFKAFLTTRVQRVEITMTLSSLIIANVGTLQG